MATQMTTSAPTVMPTPTMRPRHDTPERWQAALHRARDRGVQVRQLAGSGAWIASSTTDPCVAYEVTTRECACHAGAHDDPVCQHRAMLRYLLGWLGFDPEPEPPTPIALRQPERPCADCTGEGWWYGSMTDTRHTVITCGTCRGTGVDPHTLIVA